MYKLNIYYYSWHENIGGPSVQIISPLKIKKSVDFLKYVKIVPQNTIWWYYFEFQWNYLECICILLLVQYPNRNHFLMLSSHLFHEILLHMKISVLLEHFLSPIDSFIISDTDSAVQTIGTNPKSNVIILFLLNIYIVNYISMDTIV